MVNGDGRQLFPARAEGVILEAVREGVGDEAADRIADMKKEPMALNAEELLAAAPAG